jgi:hypothetical protein
VKDHPKGKTFAALMRLTPWRRFDAISPARPLHGPLARGEDHNPQRRRRRRPHLDAQQSESGVTSRRER